MTHAAPHPRFGSAFATFPARTLPTLDGRVRVPDPLRLVHLQLRRFAGCPICSLHLRTLARRHEELSAAGVREVAVFHSSADDLRKVHVHLPFDIVPDPERILYDELGVGSSFRAMADRHPRRRRCASPSGWRLFPASKPTDGVPGCGCRR